MMESMMDATDTILDLTKNFMVPVIFCSQLNRDMQAKWSGTIEEEVRFHAKIEEHGKDKPDVKIFNIDKHSWGSRKKYLIDFDGPTGRLHGVYKYDKK